MTLYLDDETGHIIENHPDEYIYTDDEGRLHIDPDAVGREEKLKTLAKCATELVENCDEYDVVQEPEFEWAGGE
ncbi:hypothetical protein [Haloarcula pellucida]|uniref:Uncharacterized protein n=1 Tax=Haloarcula pellucida TaxID=1427151 RepID=A0A830GQS6_9EURY|nr:hypothetical protein [Halomicroarcula pellucida]MBX0350377.1 hypothetical protein [Halomicroarcula pellucida]GGO01778.1 hypothetical protein GCM10009030_35810 [Halomicroarcula pellucida]